MHSIVALFSLALALTQQDRETRAMLALNPLACWSANAGYGIDGALRIGYSPTQGDYPNYVKQSDPIFVTGGSNWGMCIAFRISADKSLPQAIASKNGEFKLWYDRTVQRIKLTTYSGAHESTIVSPATIALNSVYCVCCGFRSSSGHAYLKVNQTETITGTVPFTPGAAPSQPLCIGYFEPASTLQAFYGIADSLGWSAGHAFSEMEMTALNAGVRWQDIPNLQHLFSDWYDFGNEWRHDPDQTEWDWLMSNVSERKLTPIVVQIASPQVVPGLFAPIQTTNTNTRALWYPDVTGNGNYMLQPWFLCRAGWHATGFVNVEPAFWFAGEHITIWNQSIGHFMPCWTVGNALSGLNVPWSAAWVFRGQPHLQQNPPDEFLGFTLGGTNSQGFVPWRPHGWGWQLVPEAAGQSVKYSTSEFYTPIWNSHVNRWVCKRQADNNTKAQIAAPFTEPFDVENWHCGVYVFDGVRSKLWIDGRMVFNENHLMTSDGRAVGSQYIRSYSIGGGCYGRDEMAFNPPHQMFSGGGWAWVGWQKTAALWSYALTNNQAAVLSRLMVTHSQPVR